MANPFTRPIAYKYKPLGFEAFATPLARKQAAYDEAISAYDDMSFDLPELPGDEKKVKAIESKLTNNLTDLRDQLTGTKDYRTAISKLKQLNKYYTSSDETQSYRSNYDSFQKYKEERRKMVEKGKLSEEDYKLEVGLTLGEFANKGGTNYDSKTGDYNPINLVRSPHNMDKEIQEWALKYAKADKANRKYMLEVANLTDGDKEKVLKQTLKYNTAQEIASAVQSALMSSDRFREYLESKADLNYRHQKLQDKNWSPNLKQRRLEDYDANINKYQNIVTEYINAATDDEKQAVADKYGISEADATDILSKLSDKKSEFSETYDSNPEATERSLYSDYFYQDRMQSESSAMGDLLGFAEEDIFGIGGAGSGSGSNSSSSKGRFVAKPGDDPILKSTGYNVVSTEDAHEMTIIDQKERIINNKKTAVDDIFGTNLAEETDLGTIKNTAEKEDINQIGAQLLQTIYGTVDPDETGMMKTMVSITAFDSENLNNNLTQLMADTQGASQKIKNILSSYQLQVSQDINDPTKFANDLRQFGIPITDENAKELLYSLNTAFDNGELSKFGEKLEALNSINRKLQTIQNREEAAYTSYHQDETGGINEAINVLNPGGGEGGKSRQDTRAWEDQTFVKKHTFMEEYFPDGLTWRGTIFDPTTYEGSRERKMINQFATRSERMHASLDATYGPLTIDQVAQKAGYKNASDAIEKGFNFTFDEMPTNLIAKEVLKFREEYVTGGDPDWRDEYRDRGELLFYFNDELKGKLGMKDMPGWWAGAWNATKNSFVPGHQLGQRQGEGVYFLGDLLRMHRDWYIEKNPGQFEQNIMAYEYSGNTSLTKGLTNIIGSIDQVPKLNLAFQTSWNDVPGFTTAGTSPVLPGTKFAEEKPKIAIMGDRLVVGIPYVYDDGGKDVANTVYVDFNTDAISAADKESMIDAILTDAHQIKDKGGHVAPYVFDVAQQARFNARYPNNGISTTYSNSLPLDKGEEVVMDEMPMVGEKGQEGAITLEIVKRQISKNEADYVLRRVANTPLIDDGYIVYGEGEKAEGEIISFETPEAVKQYLAYQFLEKLQIRNLGFDPNVNVGSGEPSNRAEKYNINKKGMKRSDEEIQWYRNHPAYQDYPEEFFDRMQ